MNQPAPQPGHPVSRFLSPYTCDTEYLEGSVISTTSAGSPVATSSVAQVPSTSSAVLSSTTPLAQPTSGSTSTISAISSSSIPLVQPTQRVEQPDDDDSDDDEPTPAPGIVGKRAAAAARFPFHKVYRRQTNVTSAVRAVGISPIPEPTDNTTIASLQVVGLVGSGPVTLSRECVSVLRWPLQTYVQQ